MPLFARAAERYMPRCWQDAVGFADRQLFILHPWPEAARSVVMSLDGASDLDSLAFTPDQRALLRQMMARGYVEECEPGAACSPFQQPRGARSRCLREVHWAFTGLCNLRCSHCFMESPANRYPEPDWQQLQNTVAQFTHANVPFVSLTGGEPLIHPAFKRLISLLSESGIAVNQIATNGLMLDDACLAMLRDAGQQPMFQISFDGVGRHDQMRGVPGVEAAVLAAIGRCVDHRCFTAVTSVFSRDNIDVLLKTYERLRDMRVSLWMISRAQTTGLWRGGPAALSTNEMGEALLSLQRRWLEDGKPFHILMENFFDARPAREQRRNPPAVYGPQSLECPETADRVFLLPDGKLLPCPGFTGTAVADGMPSLGEMSLEAAVTDSPLSRFCEEVKAGRLTRNPQCRDCDFFSECGMGCRAYALTENGRVDDVDPRACAMYRQGWKQRFARVNAEWREGED